jgi:hypothetical protein
VPPNGRVPDPVPAIMELCAAKDVVFDCGHVSGREAVALAEEAKRRGVTRMRTHAPATQEEIRAIVALGGYVEFSFFILTHATQVGLTHVDEEKHKISGGATIQDYTPRMRAAGERCILSSDAGVFLLPPPVEAFREYLLLVESEGFTEAEIRRMTATNPAALFALRVHHVAFLHGREDRRLAPARPRGPLAAPRPARRRAGRAVQVAPTCSSRWRTMSWNCAPPAPA